MRRRSGQGTTAMRWRWSLEKLSCPQLLSPALPRRSQNQNQNHHLLRACLHALGGVRRAAQGISTTKNEAPTPTHTHTHTHPQPGMYCHYAAIALYTHHIVAPGGAYLRNQRMGWPIAFASSQIGIGCLEQSTVQCAVGRTAAGDARPSSTKRRHMKHGHQVVESMPPAGQRR